MSTWEGRAPLCLRSEGNQSSEYLFCLQHSVLILLCQSTVCLSLSLKTMLGGKCLLGLGRMASDDLPLSCCKTGQADRVLLGSLDWFTAFLNTCLLLCSFSSFLLLSIFPLFRWLCALPLGSAFFPATQLKINCKKVWSMKSECCSKYVSERGCDCNCSHDWRNHSPVTATEEAGRESRNLALRPRSGF